MGNNFRLYVGDGIVLVRVVDGFLYYLFRRLGKLFGQLFELGLGGVL